MERTAVEHKNKKLKYTLLFYSAYRQMILPIKGRLLPLNGLRSKI